MEISKTSKGLEPRIKRFIISKSCFFFQHQLHLLIEWFEMQQVQLKYVDKFFFILFVMNANKEELPVNSFTVFYRNIFFRYFRYDTILHNYNFLCSNTVCFSQVIKIKINGCYWNWLIDFIDWLLKNK